MENIKTAIYFKQIFASNRYITTTKIAVSLQEL